MGLTPRDIETARESAEVFKAALADGLEQGPAALVALTFETRRQTQVLERLVVVAEKFSEPLALVSFFRQLKMIADNLDKADAKVSNDEARAEFLKSFGLKDRTDVELSS